MKSLNRYNPIRSYTILRLSLFLLGVIWSCDSGENQSSTNRPRKPAGTERTYTQQAAEQPTDERVILFYGNSLTAGYGIEPAQAFPALIGAKLDSAGYHYKVVNAGLSGETTAGGRSRIGWVLRQPVSIFVLELGGNDGLRGIPLTATKQNLQAIIDTVRAKSPEAKIVLAGMQIPPNMGPEYTSRFRELYKELATENNLALIPFLLEGVGGVRRLNQPDGIHPTPEGHKIVAKNVWQVLEPLLENDTES
ncbi:arylesterase [Nibrella viscosa]|uniref:Arylesterase n=1 Tax=Nibrella viscosa TaxID=1084524 RepID=A0ABP8KS93_9BACT